MNRRTTWILVGVALLLGAYVWYSGWSKAKTAAEATPVPTSVPGSGMLFQTTADQIAGVWIEDMAAKSTVAFSKDAQGNWQVTAPEARPADPVRAAGEAAQFANLLVSTTITEPTDLKPFGVLSPTYTLGVKLVDGTELKASVGDKTPTGSGYYIVRNGESNVVVVSTGAIEGLASLLTAPPYFVPSATPGPSPTPSPTATPSPTVTATAVTPTGTPDSYGAATELPASTPSVTATP
jgi:hypothetical protein